MSLLFLFFGVRCLIMLSWNEFLSWQLYDILILFQPLQRCSTSSFHKLLKYGQELFEKSYLVGTFLLVATVESGCSLILRWAARKCTKDFLLNLFFLIFNFLEEGHFVGISFPYDGVIFENLSSWKQSFWSFFLSTVSSQQKTFFFVPFKFVGLQSQF